MSKYTDAINAIGKPCSPKQIRNEVNEAAEELVMNENEIPEVVTAQNTASALNNLLARGQVIRGEDGLYSTPEMAAANGTDEPI